MSRPSRTKARSTRATSAGSSPCSSSGARVGLGAGRERERLAEQVQGAVVAADHEPGVDQPLDCAHGPAGRGPVSAAPPSMRGRTQHERRNRSAAIVVGEQADQLAGVERRVRHGDSVAQHMEPMDSPESSGRWW